jgi:hypothetical protein
MNSLRKICLIVIGSYFSCSVLSQQSLRFDSNFLHNSIAWQMKYKGGKKKFPKMIYDSLQLIHTFTDSSAPVFKMYGHGLPVIEEAGYIENLHLRYVYNHTDTVLVKAIVNTGRNEVKQAWWEEMIFGGYNKENAGIFTFISSARFILSGKNEVWYYQANKSETDNWVITNMSDSIFFEPGINKQEHVFYFKNKPVATNGTGRKENIRLLNGLPATITKILAVFLATSFCYRAVLNIY